jgi:glycosyltransferase involved in cell wall biosynthesis
MALGKPVVCERRSVFAERLEHGVNALLFDTVDEALGHIDFLKNNTQARNQLGANAQMWASREDTCVHIGRLKRLLRMIGT